MHLLQHDKDCKIYETGDAFIIVSENPEFTAEQGAVRIIDRALLALTNGELDNKNAAQFVGEIKTKGIFFVNPKNVYSVSDTIKNVILDESITQAKG